MTWRHLDSEANCAHERLTGGRFQRSRTAVFMRSNSILQSRGISPRFAASSRAPPTMLNVLPDPVCP